MNLRLIREPSHNGATLGVMFVDDVFFSFALEDQLREKRGVPVEQWKVKAQTAIPQGVYNVRVTFSQRFQKLLPEVLNVPGFTGIRIHSGNKHQDSEGCILLGFQRATAVVLESRLAMSSFLATLQHAQEVNDPIRLHIENPPSYGG